MIVSGCPGLNLEKRYKRLIDGGKLTEDVNDKHHQSFQHRAYNSLKGTAANKASG